MAATAFLSSLLLLGSCLSGLGSSADVDSFIATERAIALQGALNNIGPNGTLAPGTAAGLVIASPSTVNPDYFYTWTRDSALTLKMLIDEFLFGNETLQQYIEDYIHAQAVLQTVNNPSGPFLPSGLGLGEPKFSTNGARFNGNWGRPQRDGPALRATSLITYSNWLIDQGQADRVRDIIWPIISNDLSYVGQYWNETGFDLWEEVSGSSFFTTQVQLRSLVEGTQLAQTLGVECTGCDEAVEVLCFLQDYWNGKFITANINLDDGRGGVDANTILGPITVFDVNATCTSPTLQPCHSRALANFKVFVDTFRGADLYPINAGIPATEGVAVGRYPEDVYYGGNPWYLIVQGAAEFLYDAAAQWVAQRVISVDDTSLAFFQDLYPAAASGQTYKGCKPTDPFYAIVNATRAYADSFVAVAQQYTPQNGSLSEQFNRSPPGLPLSAYDLTWSYAAFVTMARRRDGDYPQSWTAGGEAVPALPATCTASETPGRYAPAVGAGAPNETESCTSAVLFAVDAPTYFGENVFLAGNTTDLGAWSVANALPLSAANYTADRPEWFAVTYLSAGEAVTYAYVRQENCGQPDVFETVNRTLVVPPCPSGSGGATPTLTVEDTWTGPTGTPGSC